MFFTESLSQADPRWKSKRLGDSRATIGSLGCLLTCMTMVSNGFGFDETPASLNERMLTHGGFDGLRVRTPMLANALPGMRLVKRVPCPKPPAPLAAIDETLAAGLPVVVKVDFSPVEGVQDHWVVIYAKDGNDYLIQDPAPFPSQPGKVTLTSVYGFEGDNPKNIIKDVIWFEGPADRLKKKPPVEEAVKPVPGDSLEVYSQADLLALRRQPFVADANLIKRLPEGAKLIVLEPKATARAKIGRANEWLAVQEAQPGGMQGYVAAWYVNEQPGEAPSRPEEKQSIPKPNDKKLVVYSNGDGLALRAQPTISEGNIIKRVPANTQFAVLEDKIQALNKIGISDQWLQVQDITGDCGYIAAWYISTERPEDLVGVREKGGEAPAPIDLSDKLVVRAAEPDLALRSKPVIAMNTLIKRVPISTEFLVLDPATEAEAKIGVVDEWLRVRDLSGQEGYVASWYVVKSPASR